MVKVLVTDQNKIDMAIKTFKRKVQKEGIVKEARIRMEYEKPSEKKKRKRKENMARNKKNATKRNKKNKK